MASEGESLEMAEGFFLWGDVLMRKLSGLDKREDSDAEMSEVMSGFIVLFCSSLVRMINQ